MPFSKWCVLGGYFAVSSPVRHEKEGVWMISHGETFWGIYGVKSRKSNTF